MRLGWPGQKMRGFFPFALLKVRMTIDGEGATEVERHRLIAPMSPRLQLRRDSGAGQMGRE